MFRMRSAVLGAMSLLMIPAVVQSQGKPSRATPARRSGQAQSQTVAVIFHDQDRKAFRDYFVTQRLVVTELPPGIAKNVARGKPLPPGIAKKAFPRSVVARQRPDVDVNIVFIMVGHNMVAMKNGVVVDIMFNVFP